MLDSTQGTARELDVNGWRPCPSGGDMLVIQQEEVHHCLVVVAVCARRAEKQFLQQAVAVAHIVGAAQTVSGYPNQEAYWKDPRGLGHGFYEILASTWCAALQRYNHATFGSDLDYPPALRHFFIGSKDVSFQALARDIDVTIEKDRPFDEVAGEAFARIRDWVENEFKETLLRNAESASAAEWRSHRMTLEDWRNSFVRYTAAAPLDAPQIRQSLVARLPAAEDALAACGKLRGFRAQPLSLHLERFEHPVDPPETREQAGRRLVAFVDLHIRDLKTAEQDRAEA
jgi:hypothetical protein